MLTVFQICFFMGIGITVLLLAIGKLFHSFDIDGIKLGLHVFGSDIFLPISPILCIIFTTVFGGVGWILVDYYSSLALVIIIMIAIIAGSLISSLVFYIVIKPIKKVKNISSFDAKDLVGIRAIVTDTIVTGGFGEIRYIIKGSSFSSPAKATNGALIRTGKDVAICWIEECVFYVASIDDRYD